MTDEREQPLRLKVVEGPDAGREFGLDRSAVIGRSARGADLVLHDPEVSRRHASLHLGEQGLKIEDLQSTNGTFVNDERVTGHRPVHPGDRLKIGTTVLEVEVAAELEPEQVTPVEGAAEEAAAVEVEADEAVAEPTAEDEPTALEVTEQPAEEEVEPEEPEAEPEESEEPEPDEPEPEVEPEVAEADAEAEPEEPEPEEAEVEPEPEEAEPAAEEAVEAESGETAEPEEAPEPEEEPAAEEPEPPRESEAPPAGVMESFGPVLHAWSNRDADEMRPYVSDAYLDRTLDALEELENDFQFNSIEELDLKDVAVRRPSGDEGEAVEAYLAFLARDWIEDLRTGEVIDGDSSEVRAFLERWTFVREGRRGWVIDRVESVWTGSLDDAASQAWPGLPPATYSRRRRPSTWRRWDGERWVTDRPETAAAPTG